MKPQGENMSVPTNKHLHLNPDHNFNNRQKLLSEIPPNLDGGRASAQNRPRYHETLAKTQPRLFLWMYMSETFV